MTRFEPELLNVRPSEITNEKALWAHTFLKGLHLSVI